LTMSAEKVIKYIEDRIRAKVKENFESQVYSDKSCDLNSQ